MKNQFSFMINSRIFSVFLMILFCIQASFGQSYFFEQYQPFDPEIPSPEKFLGYSIGEQHTRHDRIVAYFEKLAEVSEKATIETYGRTHENRRLIMLRISNPQNLDNIESIKTNHLRFVDPEQSVTNYGDVPIFIQLGYNVHGNEPSSSEAAMLTAYTLIASENQEIKEYLDKGIIFIDPTINPDGRDRHTQWANQFKANQLVSDNIDAEHNEGWPRGRTNHYWFDLNRDWLLAVHPESQGKLKWYHEWYPNVVTDFHEMGTNSTYFFEPMKPIGSQDPLMPKENYEDLNELFATYYSSALNNIGSFYYTKESFDGTYPGYGSSYPDLQGALALLFEQASSRGHLQDTDYGTISFPFTIRNQFTSSMATVKAAVENKARLRKYQQDFFKSALSEKLKSGLAGYRFGAEADPNRTRAFIDLLLKHEIKVYRDGEKFVAPLKQPQRRMVQTMFETYSKYRDSVFYDASAWSVANFYNMDYTGVKRVERGEQITNVETLFPLGPVSRSDYAYLMEWSDYNAPAALYFMQKEGLKAATAFKPFTANTVKGENEFSYGSILIPVSRQDKSSDSVFEIIKKAQEKFRLPVHAVNSGYSVKGIDLGSGNFKALEKPKPMLLIGDGVNSYEAGEVWHLLDTRMEMPLPKLQLRNFNAASLNDYNSLIMVSGSYNELDSIQVNKIKEWVAAGNTLVTIGTASKWAIEKKLVDEKLIEGPKEKDSLKPIERLPYVDASENIGKEQVGGAIFNINLDITHPLAFGYTNETLPIYKNNNVFLAPSKNAYSTVAKYTQDPHVDGFISEKNYTEFIKPAAALIVSKLENGRVVMFGHNPNFRGAWYGTNKLFLNALFLGDNIAIPTPQ